MIMPRRIEYSFNAQNIRNAHGYMFGLRNYLNTYAGDDHIPMGELVDDPLNQWSLSAEEQEQVSQEVTRAVTENDTLTEFMTFAQQAFPEDADAQNRVFGGAIQLLHDTATAAALLPRRHAYQEFRRLRRETFLQLLGATAATELYNGRPTEIRHGRYLATEDYLRELVPKVRLADFRALPAEEQSKTLQVATQGATVMARILMRYAPEYLTDENALPPHALGSIANRMLRGDPQDLRTALIDYPKVDAHQLIDAFLTHPYTFSDKVNKLAGKYPDFAASRRKEQAVIETYTTELQQLLGDDQVNADLLAANIGDVIPLAEESVTLSKGTLDSILKKNIRAVALRHALSAVQRREQQRAQLPRFSETWNNSANNAKEKLVGDYYGNVRNPRVIILPADEEFLADNFTRYIGKIGDANAELRSQSFTRMALLVDVKSATRRAGEPPITRVIEFSVYETRYSDHERITCSLRNYKTGVQAVLDLWDESAARHLALRTGMLYRMRYTGGFGSSNDPHTRPRP